MSPLSRRCTTLALGFGLLSCATRESEPLTELTATGTVQLAGALPHPASVQGFAYAYAEDVPGGVRSVDLIIDSVGQFRVDLGPFPSSRVDSLIVQVSALHCTSPTTLRVTRTALREDSLRVTLPPFVIPSPGRRGLLVPGAIACGLLVESTFMNEAVTFMLRIDAATDSVRGRWEAVHHSSLANESGAFVGTIRADTLELALAPDSLTACTGLRLQLPLRDPDSLGFARLFAVPSPDCYLPAGRVEFHEQAGPWPWGNSH